ncbi:MAG: two-component system, OmpR family, sensor histidine kinase PrrB [Streptosporangiaceae bacterium]|jgi:two-component system sensor histidine kinase PrrB|nr:two-component system, OmpR family, sensor histidine kinase PrrB [Streptosporangiaceae bacterium]
MRLSTRFALAIAVLIPVLVLLAGLLVLRLASHDLRAERDRQLTGRLQALTPLATAYAQRTRHLRVLPAEATADQLAKAAVGSGGLYLQVPGGDPLIIGAIPDPTTLPAATPGPATFSTAGHQQWRFVAADLGRRGTTARMWVVEPESRLAARLNLLRRRLLLAALLAAGVGAAAGFALGRVASRPLTVLRRQAQLIDTTPYEGNRLATASGVVEVDDLARLVNALLNRRDTAVARTGEALETARAFAATAAHELRTPLTSMGTNLSLLGHPDLPADQLDEVVADLSAEHARMQGLITILRHLAQAELIDPAAFSTVDLAELVEAAAEDGRRRHQNATIEVSFVGDVMVHGWLDGLRMIVDNLLDNAAIHGSGGHGQAAISVSVRCADPYAVLTLDDAGPGVPPEQRQAVFGRFHRRRGSPGSGLGLTLVHQQAALHQGNVRISTPPSGPGTRIELRLPLVGRPTAPVDTRSWLAGAR